MVLLFEEKAPCQAGEEEEEEAGEDDFYDHDNVLIDAVAHTRLMHTRTLDATPYYPLFSYRAFVHPSYLLYWLHTYFTGFILT